MSFFKRQDPTKLQEQVAALKGSSGFQKDEKEWKLGVDAQKNGSAVIRFLPNRSDDELAFVRIVNHSFKRITSGSSKTARLPTAITMLALCVSISLKTICSKKRK